MPIDHLRLEKVDNGFKIRWDITVPTPGEPFNRQFSKSKEEVFGEKDANAAFDRFKEIASVEDEVKEVVGKLTEDSE